MSDLASYLRECHLAFDAGTRSDRAAAHMESVVESPDLTLALYRLAEFCREHGFPVLWRHGVTLAFERTHDTYECLFWRAAARLRLGNWSGWTDYEARHFRPGTVTLRPGYALHLRWTACPWDGTEDLSDKTLMMVEEGGFGDSLQSLCFVPALVDRAKRVILMVRPELMSFVEHNFGDAASIVTTGVDPESGFDRYIWSSTLPSVLGELPPFRALRVPCPRTRASADSQFLHIGLCWASAAYEHVSVRSVRDLALLEPLLGIPGIKWHSLQVGDRATDADRHAPIHQPDPPLQSFTDTANLIAALDYVVTVDTAVCHLAGRLGIPTFVLLSYAPAWKWELGDTTPWYPSMQLIRQSRPGDWAAGIEELTRRLKVINADRDGAIEVRCPVTK